MKIVDANVLLDATNGAAQRHSAARGWLDEALAGTETVAFPWLVLLAFLRISTRAPVFARPLTGPQAVDVIEGWLSHPAATIVEPGPDHLRIVRRLFLVTGVTGDLANDMHLAALALEHDAEVVTFDGDFGRFPGVRWRRP